MLDTLLLKQKKLLVLDIMGFFFGICEGIPEYSCGKKNCYIQYGLHLSTHVEKETCYIQYRPLRLFQ